MIKSIIIFIITALISYNVHLQGKKFYDDRIKAGKTAPKVFDIGMKYIPDMSENKLLSIIIDILPLILPIIFLYNTPYFSKYYYILIWIFLIRYIFINLTILPKYKKCKDDSYTIYNILFGHCYDKIFSGHFSSIYLFVLFVYTYKLNILNIHYNEIVLGIGLLLYGMSIIALRIHYTVDIAVALVVTQLVFLKLKDINIS